jgi:cytochrome P450
VQTLFLAMALYPEVQKKAQAEIDAVIGPNRLPDFHDRPSLPYIDAILKELKRWNLVAPLGRLFVIIHHCYHPDEFRRYSTHVYY